MFVRGEPEVSSTEVTASEQPEPTPSTAVVSGKRQRDEPQVTDRSDGFTYFFKNGASNTEVFLRRLRLFGESRSYQGLLESIKEIGGNHEFFRDNQEQ